MEVANLSSLNYKNIHVLIYSYEEFFYGDCFVIEGDINIPKGDYQKYLLVQDIYGIFYYPKIGLLELKKKHELFEFIYFIKSSFKDHINEVFDYPYSSFISGLILGLRSEIPKELMESFNRVGLTHILAISGYNISIIILFVFKLFSFFKKPLRIFFSIKDWGI